MRTRPLITALALCAVVAGCGQPASEETPPAGSTLPGAEPVYVETGDWILGCDNTRHCVARAVRDIFDDASSIGERSPALMDISRRAGRVTVTISVYSNDAGEKSFTPGTISVDGKPAPGGLTWQPIETGAGGWMIAGREAETFLAALEGGRVLELDPSPNGLGVSLRGLSDALKQMAETTAGAPTEPPVVIPMPAGQPLRDAVGLAASVREAKRTLLETRGCNLDAYQDEAFALTGTEAIVLLSCNQGAYQGYDIAFRTAIDAPQTAQILDLPRPAAAILPPEEGEEVSDYSGEYTEAKFDPGTATLMSVGVGRGIGDCGTEAAWTFDGENLQLVRYSHQRRCGGEPMNWLPLYRAEIAIRNPNPASR